jgi:hypothetical protein
MICCDIPASRKLLLLFQFCKYKFPRLPGSSQPNFSETTYLELCPKWHNELVDFANLRHTCTSIFARGKLSRELDLQVHLLLSFLI